MAEFLKTTFSIEHLRWLLLTVLSQYSKVSSRLHVVSILIKNLHKYHVWKDFLQLHFAVDQANAFNFRIWSGETQECRVTENMS